MARVIVEKPFGIDLDSAKKLNRELKKIRDEQHPNRSITTWARRPANLMVFRFANAIA